MNQACLLFVKQYTATIIEKNLCQNILLHLVNMHDFGLVNTATIDKAMAHLKQQKDGQGQSKMQDDADGGSSCDGEASVSSLVNTQNHWNLILTVCVELSVSSHQTPPGSEIIIFCPLKRLKLMWSSKQVMWFDGPILYRSWFWPDVIRVQRNSLLGSNYLKTPLLLWWTVQAGQILPFPPNPIALVNF